jgi:hypothetical protein
VHCPICRKSLVERPKSYSCDCGLIIWKQICGKTITPEIAEQLLKNGRTGTLDGFKSPKSGKAFSASLVLRDKKVAFEFPGQESTPENSEQPKVKNGVIYVRVESGNSGSVTLNIGSPVNLTATINYGLVPSRMAECLGCMTAVRLINHHLTNKPRISLNLNNLEFSRYILCERTPRSREIKSAVEQLWELLKDFTWEAQHQPQKKSRLKGSPQTDKFPPGVFPWLKINPIKDGENIWVDLPNYPDVKAQFQASLRTAQSAEDGRYMLPLTTEKALWAWVNTVTGGHQL